MAPHPGINADNIREKARKDLLDLLESVRRQSKTVNLMTDVSEGSRQEEPCYREGFGWPRRHSVEVFGAPRTWCGQSIFLGE